MIKNGDQASLLPRTKMQNLMLRMMQESEALEAASSNPQRTCVHAKVHSDPDPLARYPGELVEVTQ